MRLAFTQCRKVVEMDIFQRLTSAASVASEAAIPMVNSWIRHKDDGGLTFQTFRATCIREYVSKTASFCHHH
jgi:hypothetical protein